MPKKEETKPKKVTPGIVGQEGVELTRLSDFGESLAAHGKIWRPDEETKFDVRAGTVKIRGCTMRL